MYFKKRTVYSDEFKTRVVLESLKTELTLTEFVEDLPIAVGTLRAWRRQYMSAQDPKAVNETAPRKSYRQLEQELDKVKKELERSQLEVDILKKTREYFSEAK
ncbi:transposase [Neptuniibacter sp. QD72_48]|uniref:transposase n=1 Tax=unclassified Neptuniibacter TaxID=2630693 RepID=UPI0039F44840